MSPFQSKWFFQVLILTRSSQYLFYILLPVLNICTFQSSFSVPMSSLMILNKIRVLHQHHQTDAGNNATITWLIWRLLRVTYWWGITRFHKEKMDFWACLCWKKIVPNIYFFSVFPSNVKWLWKSDTLLILWKSISVISVIFRPIVSKKLPFFIVILCYCQLLFHFE